MKLTAALLILLLAPTSTQGFAGKGFGATPKKTSTKKNKKGFGTPSTPVSKGTTFRKDEQSALVEEATAQANESYLGRVVQRALLSKIQKSADPAAYEMDGDDSFWELMPVLIRSKFPSASDEDLKRIGGFITYAIDPSVEHLENEIIDDEWRPHDELHAFMPGLGPRVPFLDPSQLQLCKLLEENYDVIKQEYQALIADGSAAKDKFQSVTSMNYEAGWKTLVLFYNGHRIPKFPYHLCPKTVEILETVPIGGRIAGFNRQQPQSGIPLHSDGNNMWLTCQMGINIPENQKASIRVGPETRHWEEGKCLLYDTTFEHETMNKSENQERVVLHVDFFNTIAMTKLEINILQYIYELREKFMKAEGVAKVGAQVL